MIQDLLRKYAGSDGEVFSLVIRFCGNSDCSLYEK